MGAVSRCSCCGVTSAADPLSADRASKGEMMMTNGYKQHVAERTQPRPPWEHIPLAQWNDWRWQLANRLNTAEDFERVIELTQDERDSLSQPGLFRVDVTPYFASLIDPA